MPVRAPGKTSAGAPSFSIGEVGGRVRRGAVPMLFLKEAIYSSRKALVV